MLIDTHTHIFLDEFSEDISDIIQRCKKHNIVELYLPNIDSSTIQQLHKLVELYPSMLYPMMGLHPCYVKENWKEELSIIEKTLKDNEYLAVGEIGIDLYWDKTFKEAQIEVFNTQLELAKELEKPVSIHSREALEITIAEVTNLHNENLSGVFHCFNGTIEQAEKILKLDNFYFGIGGVVTYKNAGVDKVVSNLPLDRIVLETDAPYLAPKPHRGKRNEPSYLRFIAEKIAEVKSLSIEEVESQTTKNAKAIFKY